jgi:hypothetical protein
VPREDEIRLLKGGEIKFLRTVAGFRLPDKINTGKLPLTEI